MIKQLLKVGRLLPVLLLCLSIAAWAQERKVSGKVTAADDGSGIPGVNVVEKGTSNGAVSDADGNYSLSVGANATLVFSAIGFATQEIAVGEQAMINVSMATDVTSLSEVVVVGYGSQDKKEITGSVVSVTTEQFNKGNINDPTQLLQGKVPGLSIYNKGGNPNAGSVIRLRGISTIGANTSPLVVIDGVLGADLNNVDPNDIESVNVLKDGSAAAIYGSRASSGVILVTTKRGSKGGAQLSYNGYISAASVFRNVSNMTASEYTAAGGNDLGSVTDWQDEVTRTAISHVHNISLSGGSGNTSFRASTNFRNVQGVLLESGFDQLNARANVTHNALDNKLKIDFNMSLTNRNNNFSFNEALRYAVLFNPTAPVKFDNGQYYQAILFDNFNPVAIIKQNINEGKRKNLNYNAKIDYAVFKDLTLTVNFGRQNNNDFNGEYYSRSSLFRGLNRGGLARRSTNDSEIELFEAYGTYSKQLNKINLDLTGGYSFQQEQYEGTFIELGNFPNDQLGYNALQNSGDRLSGLASLVNISSYKSPKNQIAAQFARVSLTYDNGVFLNASLRREGSTKLGENNRYGIFPAVGAGVDLNKYLRVADVLKVRVGYGVTGSLPRDAGLTSPVYSYNFNSGGTKSYSRGPSPDLKWEQKAETNIGVDFGFGKITGTLDVYSRNIKDFISLVGVPATEDPSGNLYKNAGSLNTKGIELALQYSALEFGEFKWTPGINISSYKSVLTETYAGQEKRALAYVGAPGQSGVPMVISQLDEPIGQIYGPVFDGVESNGAVRFKDIDGDGTVESGTSFFLSGDGDYKVLGNGIPKMELGWTNSITFRNWDLNAFFRGAFGHSLVNQWRAFYEPIDPGAINSYNRITTDKEVDGLTEAKFSSLYVEKAGFLKLDNISLGYNLNVGNSKAFRSFRLYATAQNVFQITKYTGIDPDPMLQDLGPVDNGGFEGTTPDVLAPGIDRRNNYFTARTFTFGVNVNFK